MSSDMRSVPDLKKIGTRSVAKFRILLKRAGRTCLNFRRVITVFRFAVTHQYNSLASAVRVVG